MKTYVIAATILAMIALLFGTYRAGYSQGKLATTAKFEHAVLAHRERENSLLFSLEKVKNERKATYQERRRVIGKASGDCLDRPLPESISRILYDANGSDAQSTADDGL
ncbi:MAG: hypothetical protein ACC641_07345 [Acidiferrobacterales bacterium]